jgi:hypothetical protein
MSKNPKRLSEIVTYFQPLKWQNISYNNKSALNRNMPLQIRFIVLKPPTSLSRISETGLTNAVVDNSH